MKKAGIYSVIFGVLNNALGLLTMAVSICAFWAIAQAPLLAADSPSRSELEAITSSDKRFPWAIRELMKDHYRQQRWSEFFAHAQYYRSELASREKSTKIMSLEALALLRHCQTDALESLMDELQSKGWIDQDLKNQIQSLSRTRFKGKKAQPEGSRLGKHWKGQAIKRSTSSKWKGRHPKDFLVMVENLC